MHVNLFCYPLILILLRLVWLDMNPFRHIFLLWEDGICHTCHVQKIPWTSKGGFFYFSISNFSKSEHESFGFLFQQLNDQCYIDIDRSVWRDNDANSRAWTSVRHFPRIWRWSDVSRVRINYKKMFYILYKLIASLSAKQVKIK